jgi:hypothetical protein
MKKVLILFISTVIISTILCIVASHQTTPFGKNLFYITCTITLFGGCTWTCLVAEKKGLA